MGVIHNALQRTHLSSALTRILGATKGSSGIERYGETLTPTLDLWSRPEWAYPRKEWLVALAVSGGPVAGEYTIAALVNPAGSNVLAVIERVEMWASAQAFLWAARALDTVATATLGLVGRGIARDARNTGGTLLPGRCNVYVGTDAAAVGTEFYAGSTPAGGGNFGSCNAVPLVLSPGQAFLFRSGTANVANTFSLSWREVLAQPGELD